MQQQLYLPINKNLHFQQVRRHSNALHKTYYWQREWSLIKMVYLELCVMVTQQVKKINSENNFVLKSECLKSLISYKTIA